MPQLYTLEDVANQLKLSTVDVLSFVQLYRARLSEYAQSTPPRFTQDDLRLFDYVRHRTTSPQPVTHEVILAEIDAGALNTFPWEPPASTGGVQPPLSAEIGTPGRIGQSPLRLNVGSTSSGDRPTNGGSIVKDIWTNLSDNPFRTTAIALALLFFILLISAVWRSESFIGPLASTEYARGLITFLVVFVTIAIALILILYTILGSGREQDERFNRGKEILTLFIGVLGTIVGFYFGATPQIGTRPLSTSPILVSDMQPENGETVEIMSLVSGGTRPYAYSIVSNPNGIFDGLEMGTSPDGAIQESIRISLPIGASTDVTFRIDVTDSTGETASITSDRVTVSPD